MGDNVCDIYMSSNQMYPGGQALNVAVYAKQLGVDSGYVGVFGNDGIAAHILHTLKTLSVDHTYCQQHEGENGYALVKIVNGDRVFVRSNRGGVAKEFPINLTKIDDDYLRRFDLIHTSNNSYFNDRLPIIKELGIPLSYDFSNFWDNWHITEQLCPFIDFGFLSCSSMTNEAVIEVCKKVHNLGCKIVIATMGDKGAWLFDGESPIFQEARKVEAVDTLGAGDSFIASFLVNYFDYKKTNDVLIDDKVKRETIYQNSLDKAAKFAAKNCLVEGAFGFGVDVPKPLRNQLKI
ncbi:PfkB family carbohydrate kinase [Bacillus sp. REN16]|uniref:PfkB family carbohydrate kinase n=1 Tax=Bacillus sp. REN16 TaxID=2887296 RepID=UPI003B634B6B|nr:PfkB family carbohydrate kinase [Bacillus sp. REN16]